MLITSVTPQAFLVSQQVMRLLGVGPDAATNTTNTTTTANNTTTGATSTTCTAAIAATLITTTMTMDEEGGMPTATVVGVGMEGGGAVEAVVGGATPLDVMSTVTLDGTLM